MLLKCCDTKTDGTGRIVAWRIRVDCYTIVLASFLINTWEGAVLRAEKNGTPLEEFEEIVFEKLLTSSPNPRRNER